MDSHKIRKNDAGVLSVKDAEDLSGGDLPPTEGDNLDNGHQSQ